MSDLRSLSHPGIWRGEELFARPEFEQVLVPEERAELDGVAAMSTDRALESLGRDDLALPRLTPRLLAIRESLEGGCGLVRLRGLPVDAWGEDGAARVFWALALHIGTPVSQSAEGACLFHVRDEGYAPDDPRFRGPNSRRSLSFHSDRCDVISFLCLRGARSGGRNQVVSSMALYEEIRRRRPDLLEVLCRPYVYLRHTVDTGNRRRFVELPVFSFRDGHFAANLLRVLIERADRDPELPSLSDVQREALDFLDHVAAEPSMHASFDQQPGDVLWINNWVTLHRREAFEDAAEPSRRRHLLRLWLAVPNSRPLDPRLAPHFGAVEAGAIRGGMTPR